MPTLLELDDVAKCVRRVLPAQRHLTRFERNEQAGFVEFTWHSRDFIVTPRFDVFEVKGKTLICSGSSLLLQTTLRTKEKQKEVVAAIIESIRTAEDNMRLDPERAFALLDGAKGILTKLAGKTISNKLKEPAAIPAR